MTDLIVWLMKCEESFEWSFPQVEYVTYTPRITTFIDFSFSHLLPLQLFSSFSPFHISSFVFLSLPISFSLYSPLILPLPQRTSVSRPNSLTRNLTAGQDIVQNFGPLTSWNVTGCRLHCLLGTIVCVISTCFSGFLTKKCRDKFSATASNWICASFQSSVQFSLL
jgi:hypothetical protein